MPTSIKALVQLVVIVAASLAADACTTRKSVVPEQPALNKRPVVKPDPSNPPVVPPVVPTQSGSATATLTLILTESDLTTKGLDTTKLFYHLQYLTFNETRALPFHSGTASITAPNLPIGTSGDMSLELIQDSTVKLRGVASGFTMTSGTNTPNFNWTLVGPNGGSTADLAIQVQIQSGGNGGNGDIQNPSGTNPAGTNPAGTNPAGTNPAGTNPAGINPAGTNPAGTNPPSANPPSNNPPNEPNGYFAREIKPALERYCSECHHTGKALDLSNAASTGALIDKVIEQAANGKMPPAPRDKMPADLVEKLRTWKSQGLTP